MTLKIRSLNQRAICAWFIPRLVAIIAALNSLSSDAAVVNTTGSVEVVGLAANFALNTFESNTASRLISERSSLLLTQDIAADVTQAGLVLSSAQLSPGIISANQFVDSYLLHVDPVGALQSMNFAYQGSITFDFPVIAAIWSTERLNASDDVLGAPGGFYQPATFRGYEGPGTASPLDSLGLSEDRRTVSFAFNVTQYYDQLRIVTAAVPEPTCLSLWVFSGALAVVAWSRQRMANGG
jgi:hypothetical protein